MEEDKKAENFSDALFTYLWFTENLISETTAAETVGEMAEFISEVAKAVVVLSALTVPTFNESMEEYFTKHDMSRRSVFTFLATYCFQNHAENDDIFAVVLNTCTFVYRLVIFCQHRGLVEFIDFASMCWAEIFSSDLREEFYAKGGWDELERYVNDNCYVPRHKDTDDKAFMRFLDEINYLFPKLKASADEENSTSLSESVVTEINNAIRYVKILNEESLDENDCQNPDHYVSTRACEATMTPEEAVKAYEVLTNLYGKDCGRLNCDQKISGIKQPDVIDMAHIYKTLSNFINRGVVELEASTGKIIQPKIIKNANVRHATLCCTNCQHEEQVTIISSDTERTRVYPTSIVSELVHDDTLCKMESSEKLDSK